MHSMWLIELNWLWDGKRGETEEEERAVSCQKNSEPAEQRVTAGNKKGVRQTSARHGSFCHHKLTLKIFNSVILSACLNC